MRIITGSKRGLKLKGLPGLDTRPTSDMVKEAIFSAVQFEIEGKTILDLFAGTGQLGIEALSRGAKTAYLIDNNHSSIEVIRENVLSAGFSDSTVIKEMPASAFLKSTDEKIDIAFLDPPYERKFLQKTLPMLVEKMSENGIIVCEHEAGLKLNENIGGFGISKTYRYGKIGVTIYRKNTDESGKDGDDTN